jgi:hypothetical protein
MTDLDPWQADLTVDDGGVVLRLSRQQNGGQLTALKAKVEQAIRDEVAESISRNDEALAYVRESRRLRKAQAALKQITDLRRVRGSNGVFATDQRSEEILAERVKAARACEDAGCWQSWHREHGYRRAVAVGSNAAETAQAAAREQVEAARERLRDELTPILTELLDKVATIAEGEPVALLKCEAIKVTSSNLAWQELSRYWDEQLALHEMYFCQVCRRKWKVATDQEPREWRRVLGDNPEFTGCTCGAVDSVVYAVGDAELWDSLPAPVIAAPAQPESEAAPPAEAAAENTPAEQSAGGKGETTGSEDGLAIGSVQLEPL